MGIGKCNILSFCSFLFLANCGEVEDNYIASKSPVNQAVGEVWLKKTRQRAIDGLCIKEQFSLYLEDSDHRYAPSAKEPMNANEYDFQMVWPFESNARRESDKTLKEADHITYFTRPDSSNNAIPHEYGHQLFQQFIMQGDVDTSEYGSHAPDWLDEAGAIVFENEFENESRRYFFQEQFQTASIYKLSSLLSMEHVSYDRDGQHKAQIVDYWNENQGAALPLPVLEFGGVLYYQQIRVFIDYLTEKTGNACVIANIGHFVSDGGSFENWIRTQQSFDDIDTIAELEIDFLQWLRKKPKGGM